MKAHVGPVAAMKELTLDSAVATLRAGGVIAYPTEAVWGLGCDPSHEAAVHMVLRLKQRPIEKGMILVAAELSQLEGWVRLQALPDARQRAVLASWPGANTWILPAGSRASPGSPASTAALPYASAPTRWLPHCAAPGVAPWSPPAPTWPVNHRHAAVPSSTRACCACSTASSMARPAAWPSQPRSATRSAATCCAPEPTIALPRTIAHPAAMNLLRTALGLCLLLPWTAAAAEDVRVYRCVASNGAVALQDKPCSSGRQEVRDLQRPRDPAPRVVRSDATPAPPDEVPVMRDREVRHVYIQPPQPLYECVSDDGRRYTSDNNEGNPRWVPLWTSVWLPHGHHGPVHPGPRPAFGTPIGTPIGEGTGYRPPAVGVGVQVPAGSVLVRDSCHALPPQEVCARLRDRRWELDRRYNSALQSERTAISNEQRGIDARLSRDCER